MTQTLEQAPWWTMRRAQSFKPTSYTCPLCSKQLHAMTDHFLIAPEGDVTRRRHAHPVCVRAARETRTLLTRDEWEATLERPRSGPGRLFGRRRSEPAQHEHEHRYQPPDR